jgi:hypothetical protein
MKNKIYLLVITVLLTSCVTTQNIVSRQKELMLIHKRKIGMRHEGVYSVSAMKKKW